MAKIESGIPIPSRRQEGSLSADLRALAQAKIGDSIFIEDGRFAPGTLLRLVNAVVGPGCITVRKTEGGFRAWKIAESKRVLAATKQEARQ